jgi:hypothetical protein
LSSSVPYTLSNPPAIIKKIYINFYIVLINEWFIIIISLI